MKNSGIKKIKKLFQLNYKFILLFFILSILNVFFLCRSFKSNNLTFNKIFILTLVGSILLEFFLCFILYIAKRKSWKIEKIFFILSLIIGTLYLFAIPIGRVPDEESHFFRVYEITSGNFVSQVSENNEVGSLEPKDISIVRNISKENITYQDLFSKINDQADEELVFINTSADSYNIISYLPQTVGMYIGRTLGLSYLISAYIARFFNLLCCLTILYFSIKYIPFLKEVIFFITLLPINMQALVSLSADALITVSAIALISFTFYSIHTLKTTFTKKHFLILLAICIFVSISKIVYAPLCLILFTIPKERFGNSKRKILWAITLSIVIVSVYLIWHFITPPIRNVSDPGVQISTILHNPFYYIAILINSISTNFMLYITGALGGYLEWFNVDLSMLYILSSFVIFILLCIEARKFNLVSKDIRVLSAFLFSIITVAIFTALYISWNKAGEVTIDGVQGRYFLPIMLLIPLMCLPTLQDRKQLISIKKPKQTEIILNTKKNYYLYIFFIFESIYAISTIACTHI